VFQEYNLIPTLSAVENIELALLGRGMPSKHRYTRAGMVLARVGLEQHPHHAVSRLSGGERQRVAIARALVVEPEVLICDEVTSALDVSVQAAIVELLHRLQRTHGVTLLLVTHNLALVRSLADDVLIVRDGHIVEHGPSVLDQPKSEYAAQLLTDVPRLDPA
jgi:peptide/nickel transport system ATP-binding protein